MKKMRIIFCLWLLPLLILPIFKSVAAPPFEALHSARGRTEIPGSPKGLISLSLRNVPIAEAIEILARKGRVNILLDKEAGGDVSLSLYEVELDEAIAAVAESAGCAVRRRARGWSILPKKKFEEDKVVPEGSEVRSFKVEYSDVELAQEILSRYLSDHGVISAFPDRKRLLVEDFPENLDRIETILAEIDQAPKQILIEGKILEVALDENESFGLDWTRLFSSDGGDGNISLQGFANTGATGLVASLQNSAKVDFVLNMLNQKGRLHTLSTPKLRALENEEASVIIGDRQGFKVTTTINQVTTESIEFLESGVILKVTPSVDQEGKILMKVHPEISNGAISNDGIPSQTTTEVTTVLLANNGQTIFIGGLIKSTANLIRAGVPVLGDIPLMGRLFSSSEEVDSYSETVVLITPKLVGNSSDSQSLSHSGGYEGAQATMERRLSELKDWVTLSGGGDRWEEVSLESQ